MKAPGTKFATHCFPVALQKMPWSVMAIFLGFCAAAACSSKEKNVKEIDATLDTKGTTSDKTLGLNKEGNAVLQQKKSSAARLVCCST